MKRATPQAVRHVAPQEIWERLLLRKVQSSVEMLNRGPALTLLKSAVGYVVEENAECRGGALQEELAGVSASSV